MTASSATSRHAASERTAGSGPESRHPSVDDVVTGVLTHLDGTDQIAARRDEGRVRELAGSLLDAARRAPNVPADGARSLEQRIVTDDLLRGEADRDQNVYLGRLYTRVLTRARPDVIFLPLNVAEVQVALRWARGRRVPVTIRGAASSALGGAVPNDGGLCLDLARLEQIDVDTDDGVCVIGGGVRFRDLHRKLAARDLALPVYPSNLGATFAGWFVTGGLGYNAFSPGCALDIVRVAELVLPDGDVIRLHADGRLDVPGDGRGHRELPPDLAESWFRGRGIAPFSLRDLAGSEGRLGVVVRLVLAVGRRPAIGALLLGFERREDAFAAVEHIRAGSAGGRPRPANLKLFYRSYLEHVRKVWADDDRAWRRLPSELSGQAHMPWRLIAGPRELDVAAGGASGRSPESPQRAAPEAAQSMAPVAAQRTAPEAIRRAAAEAAGGTAPDACSTFVYVDFRDLAAARAFAAGVSSLPGCPAVIHDEAVRLAADRFRPQASRRFGPGLLAAEVDLPAAAVPAYLAAAAAQARRGGLELDPEVYYTANGRALTIAGYLTDHRSFRFQFDLLMAPALLDLAIRDHGGRPYVIGRWQAPFAASRLGRPGLERLRALNAALDPDELVNRGVLLGFRLRPPLGPVVEAAYGPGVRLMRGVWSSDRLAPLARLTRRLVSPLPGPGHGRGAPAGNGDLDATARALHCVNCGECNDVCPVFDAAAVRLPQSLVHAGELVAAGRRLPAGVPGLLELCMRCGSCEEVCQAGIPHLAVYGRMDAAARRVRPYDADGHAELLGTLRGSPRYRSRFLDVRPGMYLRRSPAAQPGVVRFLVVRAEAADGPAATCLHCGACVGVCPTGANHEFEADDARTITTDEYACIGCAVCVEVCPANRGNGGQTLRVMAAPAADWERALDGFLAEESR